jgi:hypothetical protein
MAAVFGMIAGAFSATASGVGQVVATSGSVFCFGVDMLLAVVSFAVEIGGYAFTTLTLAFTFFIGCCLPMYRECLRPASEWDGSEAKRAGCCLACASCVLVCSCILFGALLIAFLMTAAWYDEQLRAENTNLWDQLGRLPTSS